jgi:eukaryotic-like serine/threonine-protein kinase
MEAPLRLGNYEPLLELASGGMATVYVARQVGAAGFERIVVLKRVHKHLLGNREFTDMFRDEARVASMIRHPNVVAVNDVIEADKELFLVMDYIEGCAVASFRKAAVEQKRSVESRVAVRIISDALAGLHAAHEARDMRGQPMEVVHRDISPQNILLGTDGASRIIDFGVAKARHRLTETKSGSLKGKYGYMSPEQARGQPVDRRTDLFAIGTVLHELLTGKRLFRGENELDTMRRILEVPIDPPSSINPEVPKSLDDVVAKALARDVDARFQSATEMIDALERACPPASAHEVARLLQEVCHERLQERAEAIRAMLEGRQAPLSLEARDQDDGRSTATKQGEKSAGTEGKITVMDALHEPRRNRTTAMVIAALALVGALVGVTVLVAKFGNGPTPDRSVTTTLATMASSAPTVAIAPSATPSVIPATDEVTISLTADAPIENVSAPGMRRVELEGTTARLVVATPTKELKVDATLKGGKRVSATLATGVRQAKLAAPIPTGKPTAAPTATELQSNPYGGQ